MTNFLNKNIFVSVCSFLLLVAFSFPVIAEEKVTDEKVATEESSEENKINNLKFPKGNWDMNVYAAAEEGRNILVDTEFFEVAPPPLNDSKVSRDEIDYLIEISKTERTKDAMERIYYENAGGKAHEFFMKEMLLDGANYKTISLMTMIDVDHMYFILERKKHFSRPRPSMLAEAFGKELELVIPNPGHPAYPSGHASQTHIVALVLADFDPEHADIYKQFSVDVAHRCEIAGVHYPSDSVAGRKLAIDVLAALRKVPVFEKKYQEAKATFIVSEKVKNIK